MTSFNIKLLSLTTHDTLEISLGDSSFNIDLYYYCLDNTFLSNDQDIAKGLLNFFVMLENWKAKINSLNLHELDFLPFDYSDEYISFFIISKINTEDILIQAAFTTEYQGWGINPSQLYSENILNKPYSLYKEKCEIILPINQLLLQISSSTSTILNNFYIKPYSSQ